MCLVLVPDTGMQSPHLCCTELCLQDHSTPNAGSGGRGEPLWMWLSPCTSESWSSVRLPVSILQPPCTETNSCSHFSPKCKIRSSQEKCTGCCDVTSEGKIYKKERKSAFHCRVRRATDSKQHGKPSPPNFLLLFCLNVQTRKSS